MASKAVCLLSGGLDSCVSAAIAARENAELYALSFNYGQRHLRELKSARQVARRLRVKEHKILRVDLGQIGGSALTDDIAVPEGRSLQAIAREIPVTYVPARNTIFLAFALAYAEVVAADRIYIGANALDFSGYPDCRPEYYRAYQTLANLATKRAVEGNSIEILTPLIDKTKSEIIKLGLELNAPIEHTWSCYKGLDKPCGKCDSCILRAKGFAELGIEDPAMRRFATAIRSAFRPPRRAE